VSYTNKFRELRLGNELNDNFDFYSSLKIYLQNWRKGKDIRLKGGENFKDLINRAIPFLKELIKRNRGKKLVIVTHQTVIQAIIGYYRKLPFVRMVNELNIKCGQIFIIKFSRDNKVYIKLIGLT
jgi:broad specificity phosphatase PhoE